MSSDTKLIVGVAAAAGVGLLLYSQMSNSNANQQYHTVIPPGGYYGGYQNQGNTALYVNFAGQVLNTLGQLVGTLANNGVFTPASDDGDGYWSMLGPKVGCGCEGENYGL